MNQPRYIIGLFLFLQWAIESQGQVVQGQGVQEFASLMNPPREKVYIRTNKEWYTASETIWFSTVLVDAKTHVPGGLSSVIYVDLIDPNGKVRATRRVISVDGFGQGQFELNAEFGEATWLIRGYTAYMRNFSKRAFFYRHITVLNEDNKFEIDKKRKRPLVQFHQVKGGVNVVYNLVALDEFHLPLSASWEIQGNDVATTTQTNNWGLGTFTAGSAGPIAASFEYKGRSLAYDVPPSKKSYDLLQVESSKEKVLIGIDRSGLPSQMCYLYGVHHGQIFLRGELPTGKEGGFQQFDKSQLPGGILTFLLVDENDLVLSHDVCFNDFEHEQKQLVINGPEFVPVRDSVVFDILHNDTTVWAHLSVSVLSDNKYLENRLDIGNFLELSSELSFSVNPDLVLASDDLSKSSGATLINRDNLVLLQPTDTSYSTQVERGFSIEGKVSQYLNKRKGSRARVKLQFLEDIAFLMETETDEKGHFRFDHLPIGDTLTALVTATPMKVGKTGLMMESTKKKVLVDFNVVRGAGFDFEDVNHLMTESLPQDKLEEINDTESYMETISQIGEDGLILLDEVEIEAAPDVRSSPYYREGMTYLKPERRMVMDSLPGSTAYTSIWRFLMSQIAGSKLQGEIPELSFLVRPLVGRFYKPVSFIVDGSPMTASQIDNFPVKLIDLIDLVQGGDALEYEPLGNPVILIYTRKGTSLASILPEADGVRMKKVTGYSPVWDYADKEQPEGDPKIPDIRHSLYWDPHLLLQKGKASFTFKTSNETGPFTIYLEGITANGEVLMSQKKFVVQ